MDPLVAVGLFVGIPVALAIVVVIAIMVPQRYGATEPGEPDNDEGAVLITSTHAAPDPAALPRTSARVEATGGAHGSW